MLRSNQKSVPITIAAAMLLLAAGCASSDQTALQGRCNAGDQSACDQIARDESAVPSPANPPRNQALQLTPGPGAIPMR